MSNIYKHIIVRKTIWSLFLACFFMVQPLAKFALLLNYAYNYDYYSTVLCENINKPEMKCHGSCKLSKQMDKMENKSTNESKDGNSKRRIITADSDYIFNTQEYLHQISLAIAIQNWQNIYKNQISSVFRNRIFHPPKKSSFV